MKQMEEGCLPVPPLYRSSDLDGQGARAAKAMKADKEALQ